MDRVELIAVLIAAAVIVIAVLIVIFRPSFGGERSGQVDYGPPPDAGP